jgi:hypothetical protein
MEPQILLAQLRALIERAPDLESYSPTSREHMVWLGQAHALVDRWNRLESISFKSASNLLSMESIRQIQIGQIFGILHRAIADLELQVPSDIEVNFAAGDVYDFFKALNKVIASAEKSLFIVDPYLDESVFDHYLNSRQPEVKVRLLLSHKAEDVLPASQKYIAQYGEVLELRKSKALHDRVVFIDGYVCWLIGQSVKDAAKAKPTYLVQLPPDVVSAKLQNYEDIWSSANAL